MSVFSALTMTNYSVIVRAVCAQLHLGHINPQITVAVRAERGEMPLRWKWHPFWLPRAAHPNAKLNANCSLELRTMNGGKVHLFARHRVESSFGTLADRTIREERHEERRLAEQRATKHRFQARNSCILDGRNYRIARRLLLLARAQF